MYIKKANKGGDRLYFLRIIINFAQDKSKLMDYFKYLRSNEFKEILARYEQAQKDGTNEFFDADDLLDIGEYYHSLHDIDAACRAAEYCLELYPDNQRAMVFVAKCAICNSDIETAERISQSIGMDEEIDVVYLRAELMLLRNQYEDADKYLQDYFDGLQDDDDIRYDFVIEVPALYCDYGCWQLAERWLLMPENDEQKDDLQYLDALGRVYTNTNRFAEAIPLWNKYIDKDSFCAGAWLMLAQCQYHIGLCHEAMSSAEYCIAINPDLPDGYLAAGNASFALGRSNDALSYFTKFLDLAPGDAQGELLIATVLFAEERYDDARAHIEVAVDGINNLTDEDIPAIVFHEIYKEAAFICSAQGDIKQSLIYLDRLLFHGMSEDAVLLLRAAILLEAKQTREAFNIFNDILTSSGHDPEIYIQIGMMVIDASFYDLGYSMLSTTIKVLTESGMACEVGYDRLAYACLMLDKYDEFLEALEKSIKFSPSETVTIFSPYFPEDTPITEYIEYARKNKLYNKPL